MRALTRFFRFSFLWHLNKVVETGEGFKFFQIIPFLRQECEQWIFLTRPLWPSHFFILVHELNMFLIKANKTLLCRAEIDHWRQIVGQAPLIRGHSDIYWLSKFCICGKLIEMHSNYQSSKDFCILYRLIDNELSHISLPWMAIIFDLEMTQVMLVKLEYEIWK